MSEDIKLKRNGKYLDAVIEVESRPYIDSIYKIAGINIYPEDSLIITYNIKICGFTNDEKTSEITERFKYKCPKFKKKTLVVYIRFTKMNDDASIRTYERMPKDLYIPKWNAKKVE